jgi:sodium-dependent phosphate transporter
MAAAIFATVKYAVLERENPLKNALRFIPFYLAFTASMLALFIVSK